MPNLQSARSMVKTATDPASFVLDQRRCLSQWDGIAVCPRCVLKSASVFFVASMEHPPTATWWVCKKQTSNIPHNEQSRWSILDSKAAPNTLPKPPTRPFRLYVLCESGCHAMRDQRRAAFANAGCSLETEDNQPSKDGLAAKIMLPQVEYGSTSDFLTWTTRGFECARAFPSVVCAHRLHRTIQEQCAGGVGKRPEQSNICQP